MAFTFRPSIGADVIFADGAAGLIGIDFYSENGGAIVLSRALFGQTHQYLSGAASIAGTAGSDTLFANDSAGTPDIIFWDPSTVNQIVAPSDFTTPLTNNAAASIDVVILGAGDDILTLAHDSSNFGNPGAYTLAMTGYGGDGNDFLWMGAGADAVFGDAGNDVLAGQGGGDTLQGGAGLDTLFGGSGADLLQFNNTDIAQGADTYQVALWTGVGANPSFSLSLAGGSGYDWSRDLFDGGADIDTLRLSDSNDLLLMNVQDLTVNGATQSSGGNQFTGVEVIDGQAGNDVISVNNAAGGIAFTGALTIAGGAGFDVIVSGAGDDLITGGNLVGAMAGGDRDTAYGGAGNDRLFGDSQDDPLNSTGGGIDTLYGGDGNDTVYGGAATDTLYGEASQDTLYGGTGDDSVYGGAAADTVSGDAGTDRLFAGAGLDLLLFSADATVAAAGGDDGVQFWTGEGAVSVASHIFTADANRSFDTFNGEAGTDTFSGGAGNEVLVQNSSALFVNGATLAAGADRIVDIEILTMGAGDDVLVLNDAAGGIAYAAAATAFGGSGRDLLVTGNGDDRLAGAANNAGAAADASDTDTIFGGGGNDVIFGDQENRTNTSEGGSDTLYGGSGDDSIFGNAGDDTIQGGDGIDLLSGGTGNDRLMFSADANVEGELVAGWDGGHGDGLTVELILEPGTVATLDSYAGSSGFDMVDLRSLSTPGSRVFFSAPAGVQMGNFMSGIEMIYAGAGADIIILSKYEWMFDEYDSYASDVTIVGGADGDVVFSGSGSDRVYGDHLAGTASPGDGNDTLFGGAGNDVIYGDSVDGQQVGADAGRDTLYGGDGADVIYGGGNDDMLFDKQEASLFGGAGHDLLAMDLAGVFVTGVANAGSEGVGDGDDRVFVSGYYDLVTSELGAGNDVFISNAFGDNGEGESGRRIDSVSGGTGNDLISSWDGDDILDGGANADVIWGGAGVDTIMGGADSDYLYGGFGDGDLLIGGDGGDFYYWARNDGADRIEDQDPGGVARDNYILVFAGFETNPANDLNGDAFIDGAGVFEADGNLYDNDGDDMVQITVDPEDSSRLVLTVLQGEGAGSTLNFDPDEITMIGLSNSDTGQVTAYQWVDIMGHPQGGEYQLLA